MKFAIVLFLLLGGGAVVLAKTPQEVHALYTALPSCSIAQHLAFYRLYPDTTEGKQALAIAWSLLMGQKEADPKALPLTPLLSGRAIDALIFLTAEGNSRVPFDIGEEELMEIEKAAGRLANRQLKGYGAQTEEEVLQLAPEQIDLARGLLLSQLGPEQMASIQRYEAVIDLIALQVLACLPQDADPQTKIAALNRFIFEELHFRFPPHSIYAENIDTYTFLPSVLDSREGVCLGVCLLYLSIGQRISLPLEVITPPGHIFVRWKKEGGEEINIETTCRGVHLPTEVYLGVDTPCLIHRNIKETIGQAHVNEASVWWQRGEHDRAVACYEKARLYLGEDPWVCELMGLNLIFCGRIEEGKELLQKVRGTQREDSIAKETLAEDYLAGKVDAAGLLAVFMHVDETRSSILEKQKKLQNTLTAYPEFREGWLQLAVTYLQLHRTKEAITPLLRYYALDPGHPVVAYYLALLYTLRIDYPLACKFLYVLQATLKPYHHEPMAVRRLKQELMHVGPVSYELQKKEVLTQLAS